MPAKDIAELLACRFGEVPELAPEVAGVPLAEALAGRASCRAFAPRPVDVALLRSLAALALCAPSKSDLQQADIVLATDPELRAALAATVPGQAWVAGTPALLVVCGNNRRQRQVSEMRGREFANDHLDAFFNAAVDGGIVLATLVLAAEAAGLGACPISGLRDRPEEVSDLLGLPAHVFPLAGLALGYPVREGRISPRLPLEVTVHENRWSEAGTAGRMAAYDARRRELQPYASQRGLDRFGEVSDYGWLEDKARQYAEPQRADFGAFVRRRGFRLD
ncbi:MAG: nitroreductase family protein [Geminicoccaceae bacterium]|jgi:nitroreductase/FMN reductase [NAD(P)H]|nr:nitroreductase family protein [Geminicoccaceae bacterium]MCB9967996.1 nitroreductase family protein [Geminicoccaceae bacterium]HRY26654.1 nitroreductase family protein [Geminicoccaceae bacterium]